MSDAANSDSGFVGLIAGKGFFQQVLLVLITLTILFFLFVTVEYLVISFMRMGSKMVELMPYTIAAEDKQYVFRQDLNKYPDGKQLLFSDNERTGTEFSYSFFLYVNPSTFSGDDVLKHVFHKGFTIPWPLLGPGVFVKGDSNTLRIIMNSYKNPMTFVDVENIPVRKWFHCVLICRKNNLEVYLNGNLIKKLPFEGSLAYQNFQDLTLFSTMNFSLSKTTTVSLEKPLRFNGAFSGSLSNLFYFAYALSYTEIQALTAKGISSKTLTKAQDMPPYLTDTYWTTSYQQQI
jgi:hypothetical protein